MATDLGQPYNPNPVDGMRQFIRLMMKLGLSEREIGAMTRDNPSRLLGI
jgi:predicted metal-dependent phosphotriesterase family hydrolase